MSRLPAINPSLGKARPKKQTDEELRDHMAHHKRSQLSAVINSEKTSARAKARKPSLPKMPWDKEA